MYAIIQSGGKQYRVTEGQVVKLEKLEAEPGASVTFDRILMVGEGDTVKVGAPLVAGASVTAEVLEQGRAKKIWILKFRRRKHHMKQMWHRQYYTAVRVTTIKAA